MMNQCYISGKIFLGKWSKFKMEEDTEYMKLPVEERCVHKVLL